MSLLYMAVIAVLIYAIWKYTKWSKTHKFIASGLVAIVLIVVFGSDSSVKVANDDGKQASSVPAKPAKPLTEEAQIRNLVATQLKGQNNLKQPYMRKIEVKKRTNGGWEVLVEFNASDNISKKYIRGGIEMKMSEIYTALYRSGKDVRTAKISAYFPYTDKYGNNFVDVVYKSTLDKVEADKVNWNADESLLKLEILPRVWKSESYL